MVLFTYRSCTFFTEVCFIVIFKPTSELFGKAHFRPFSTEPFNLGLIFRICKPRCSSFNQVWYIWLMFLQEIKDVPVETFDVELVKDSRGLGITIAGYVEQSSGTLFYMCCIPIMSKCFDHVSPLHM